MYSSNYDMAFKVTNKLKVKKNDNLKFNGNFKRYIIVKRTLKKHIHFPF
jgi:hypothetical protein